MGVNALSRSRSIAGSPEARGRRHGLQAVLQQQSSAQLRAHQLQLRGPEAAHRPRRGQLGGWATFSRGDLGATPGVEVEGDVFGGAVRGGCASTRMDRSRICCFGGVLGGGVVSFPAARTRAQIPNQSKIHQLGLTWVDLPQILYT